MDTPSNGIRASDDSGFSRPRIVSRDGNYRVWSTVMEQALRERKLWGHITGTAVPPPLPRPVSMAIAAVAAAAGVDPVEAAPAVTPEMSNKEFHCCEDFVAAMAKANSVLLSALEDKDVMASMMMSPPKKSGTSWLLTMRVFQLDMQQTHEPTSETSE